MWFSVSWETISHSTNCYRLRGQSSKGNRQTHCPLRTNILVRSQMKFLIRCRQGWVLNLHNLGKPGEISDKKTNKQGNRRGWHQEGATSLSCSRKVVLKFSIPKGCTKIHLPQHSGFGPSGTRERFEWWNTKVRRGPGTRPAALG